MVSRENKRCEWDGKRFGKQQLVHGKDTGEMKVQNLGKDCETLKGSMGRLQTGLL